MLGGMLGNVVDEISGKNKSGRKIKGKVILMNKSVLDINDLLSFQSAQSAINSAYDQLLGQQVSLQLISSENADSENGNKGKLGKPVSLERWRLQLPSPLAKESLFAVSFDLDEGFGTPGAILVRNNQASEFYLKTITLEDVDGAGQIHFVCNSWIYPDNQYNKPRIFFSNKTYLPHETPALLRKHREEELEVLRGDGKTELKTGDRVYDYATYNDLGDPDWNSELARPVLGGSAHRPYPRRGRTSRPPSKSGETLT
ncbi:Lipoxygenase [Corchorus capsularis]|uniref:Lipoxygenase n=1 Tax=Corchorus capsularis TaxID=210143 RepID=A0A1R3H2G4_COCAP|nr:Lipoxygenase [Corchorus capsularis]